MRPNGSPDIPLMDITKMPAMTNRTRSLALASVFPSFPSFFSLALAAAAMSMSAGCDKEGGAREGASDAALSFPTSMRDAAIGDAASDARPDAAKSDAGTAFYAPITAQEKIAFEAYLKALGHGRELTRKKDFPGAIRSFDDALAQIHDDAHALA